MSSGSMDRTLSVGDIILVAYKFPEDVFPCAVLGKINGYAQDEDDYLMYVIQLEDGKTVNVYPERVFAKVYLYSNLFKAVLLDVEDDDFDFEEEDSKWLAEQEQRQKEAEEAYAKERERLKENSKNISLPSLPVLFTPTEDNKPLPVWGGSNVSYQFWSTDQLLDALNNYLPLKDDEFFGGVVTSIIDELKKRG